MKKINCICSVVLAFILIATLVVGITANAAAFSGGSGTKQDPYLLKTASDVQNIKNNLSSHFKLAATIDLSSIKEFEPIGCLGKPFTGTITCDLGADGLPKYALLNLNQYNHAGEIGNHVFAQAGPGYYAHFDKSGFSHYETGLFGATDSATFQNIIILNAEIKSTVVGQHQGVYYGTERRMCAEQVDAQGTAILVGIAENSNITGCGVQGEITSDSNSTAGLVGKSVGCNISYCWADINSKTRGFWYSAGLVGYAQDSTSISYSYAKGEIHCTSGKVFGLGNGACGAGLVAGISPDSMVSDSYSEVNFAKGSVVTGVFTAPTLDGGVGMTSNCYASGVIEGVGAANGADSTDTNCWILNTSGQQQTNFKLGSAANIKSAFANAKGWNTKGKLPTLSDLNYIDDYKMFVVGKERSGAGSSTPSNSTSATSSATSSQQTSSGTTDSSKQENSSNVQSGQTDVIENNNTDGQDGTDKEANTENATVTQDGEIVTGDAETVVQSEYRDSVTYIVLFVALTAVVICITVASLCLLLKSVQKLKLAQEEDEEYTEE